MITLAALTGDHHRSTVTGAIRSRWVLLFPLIAASLAAGQVAGAVLAARRLLDPYAPRTAAEIRSLIEAASAAWDSGESRLAGEHLAAALTGAGDLGYW